MTAMEQGWATMFHKNGPSWSGSFLASAMLGHATLKDPVPGCPWSAALQSGKDFVDSVEGATETYSFETVSDFCFVPASSSGAYMIMQDCTMQGFFSLKHAACRCEAGPFLATEKQYNDGLPLSFQNIWQLSCTVSADHTIHLRTKLQ